MSWGKGITLLLASFILMIVVLVYKSTQQRFNLVTDHYYEESLDYDKVQRMNSNYTALDEEAKVVVDQDASLLYVVLPSVFDSTSVVGKVHLYSPVDSRLDHKIALTQPFSFSTQPLRKGMWKVMVDWEASGKAYRFERAVIIN